MTSQNQKNGNDNDNSLGKSTNDDSGHDEHYGNLVNELVTLKAKVQTLEAEARQISLDKKLQESEAEFAAEQKLRSLEEKYLQEIAELKVKNQQLTEESKTFEETLKEMSQMKKIGETEDEIVLLLHEMKVQLPLENWHDLLAFVPRPQLGNVASEAGGRQFAHILQSFLHDEVREITLSEMRIYAPRPDVSSDQPMVKVWPNEATNMLDWPMPGNVKDFKEIHLNYVDLSVLKLLRKFRENSLLENVNLYFTDDLMKKHSEAMLLRALTQILPMISSIDSIHLDPNSVEIDLFNMVYNNTNTNNTVLGNSHETQLLLKEMMAQTRILMTPWYVYGSECSWADKVNWCCSWLYAPRSDGKPRVLQSYNEFYDHQRTEIDCTSFIERIKKDFKMANHPVSFFIYACVEWPSYSGDISIENVKTNEKLVIKVKTNTGGPWYMLLISRYPRNAAKCWIEANEKEIYEWPYQKRHRTINLDSKLTNTM